MRTAVEFGRVEMIEVLEQDGQPFKGCISAALDRYQTQILQWLLETNKYDDLTKTLDDHLHFGFTPNKEGIGIVLSHMYCIEPNDCFDTESLFDRWIRENEHHLERDVVLTFASADFLRSRISTMSPFDFEYLFRRHPFDADLVSSVRPSLEMRYIILEWNASSDAVRYYLKHFDQSTLHLWIDPETITDVADCIDFDSSDWWKLALSMKHLIALQNAGAPLTKLNKSGETILPGLSKWSHHVSEQLSTFFRRASTQISNVTQATVQLISQQTHVCARFSNPTNF